MAAGDPTGADLVSGTTDGNTLPSFPTAPEEREITFGAGVELTSGVKYAIVVRAPAAGGILDGRWQKKLTGTYPDGDTRGSSDSGSSWSAGDDSDLWFKTYAGAALKESHTFADAGVETFYGLTRWRSQSFTASETYTITSVKLELRKDSGESPGTITVGIRATESAPTKATNPTPSDANSDVTLDQATITWEDGGGATSYNVYYGDTSGDLSLVSSGQAGVSFTVTGITLGSPYEYLITRYWRIDSINASGTTTGDEWSFTTIRIKPPAKTYWYSATNIYYRLLVDADGNYGDPPPTGVENTDYEIVAGYLPNVISTARKLVGVADNKVWFEDI